MMKQIILTKSEDLANFLISVVSILDSGANKRELIIKETKLFYREKEEQEIFDFNLDYKRIINMYLFEFSRNPTQSQLELSKDDSELFRKSIHAAYYLIKETDCQNEFFENYYNKYFRSR